ncbi:MAG TPA: PPE family protein [Mycobacterium sp.]|jgi:PPE-repeat protein|uniref:PPE family protein n=1 Tax=Mycobacterium sp. TaxID=1785 RepID=UPI002F415DFB
MTAPIFMAAPPEVHSALLSSGPGPGSLLAAAGAWNSLSAEYTEVAEEISTVLAEVQTGAWQGPSAEEFVSAYVPYLAWLTQASADSAAAATQHETAAAAYTAALAAMPTMPELATNHVVHGVLQATNFFGINTIPIALNEADYVRMWIQAATTMSTYQAVSSAAVASTPATTPAPQIVKSDAAAQPTASGDPYSGLSADNPLGLPQWLRDFLNKLGIGNSPVAHAPRLDYWFDDLLANYLQQNFGINWSPSAGTVNGASYDSYADPSQLIYYVARSLELFEDVQQFGTDLVQNPVAAFQYLFSWELFDFPLHIEEVAIFLSTNPVLLLPVVSAAIAPAGAGAIGLAGLAAIPPPTAAPAPLPALPPLFTVAAPAPAVVASSVAPGAPAPTTPATAASAPAGPPPPTAPPPPPAGPGFAPPYIVGGPTMESWMSAKAKMQEPTTRGGSKAPAAAAAVVAAAQERTRKRGRQRAKQRGYGDEFMNMNVEVDPDWAGPRGEEPVASTAASDRGAGPLGFAGTSSRGAEQAAGLATLHGDEFGAGPTMPMVPGTWGADPEALGDSGDGRDQT